VSIKDEDLDHLALRNGSDMGVAAARLTRRFADRNRAHLNAVSEAVYASHAGEPAGEVLAVLMRDAETPIYEPDATDLNAAANAISKGRRFHFV
jgi:hypothetical protein